MPSPVSGAASAAANTEVVGSAGPGVFVEDGDTATVTVTARADGAVLAEPVSVDWRTGSATATADADYEAGSGTLEFAAGTPSGTERTITIRTRESEAGETAETVPSYSSMDWTDDGLGNPVKMHAHDELINGWLPTAACPARRSPCRCSPAASRSSRRSAPRSGPAWS